MKCSICGCEELFAVHYAGGMDTSEYAKAYACAKCRHIEFYATEEQLNAYLQRKKDSAVQKRQHTEYVNKKKELEAELKELNRIIKDKDQTVRAVESAKKKKSEIELKLSKLYDPGIPDDSWRIY